MTIVFVNEKCGWFGGVEQNIALSAAALRLAGFDCQIVYQQLTANDPLGFQALFSASHHCPDMLESAEALGHRLHSLAPAVVYYHKAPFIPSASQLHPDTAGVRMIHDHDLCCPRRHKYFIHTARVCHYPLGWRCWLDCAFLSRSRAAWSGFRFVSINAKRHELLRTARLDALIVASSFMRAELCMNGFPPERIHVLPPVVPPVTSPPTPPPAERRILYVGQLIRGKGVDLLLRAVARMPDAPMLEIVGVGNARASLERQAARLGLLRHVTFHGWRDSAALGDFYRSARVVAVPSRWPEPFGMVGIEAMRQARPVVAFAVGGIPDWCSDGVTGLLIPEQDIDAFANGLSQILDHPGLADRLGSAAHKQAQVSFSFDQYITTLSAVLQTAHQEKTACASA